MNSIQTPCVVTLNGTFGPMTVDLCKFAEV